MDRPDFKSWNDAFTHLNIKGDLGLEFSDPPDIMFSEKAEVGYSTMRDCRLSMMELCTEN